MKRSELDKKVSKILGEEETFLLSLILLAHMHEDDKYKNLSELIFLFDNYKGFKQFIKFYEGQTIDVPTVKELKQSLRLLALFQKVKVDNRDFDKSYEQLKMNSLDLSKQYCLDEIEKFKSERIKKVMELIKKRKKELI